MSGHFLREYTIATLTPAGEPSREDDVCELGERLYPYWWPIQEWNRSDGRTLDPEALHEAVEVTDYDGAGTLLQYLRLSSDC